MVIPEGFAQVNLLFGGIALPLGAEMTLGLDISATEGETPTTVGAAVNAAFTGANLPAELASTANYRGCLVKFGPNATGPSATVTTGPVSGTGAAVNSPGTSALIEKNTALGGRAGKGRFYMPGIQDLGTDPGGTLKSGYATSLFTKWNNFRTALLALELVPVVLHAPGGPISVPTPITGFSVDGRVGTQRRRNRR